MGSTALGLIETRGFVGVVEAADAAVKAAAVDIRAVEQAGGDLIAIHLSGDVGAVHAAVAAAAHAAQRVGHLVSRHVIPNPHPDLLRQFGAAGSAPAGGPLDLDRCSVVELRRIARGTPGLPIQGREISRANREQLIQLLREAGLGSPGGNADERGSQ